MFEYTRLNSRILGHLFDCFFRPRKWIVELNRKMNYNNYVSGENLQGLVERTDRGSHTKAMVWITLQQKKKIRSDRTTRGEER